MKILPLLNEALKSDVWYHGTPDVRQLEQDGGFTQRNLSIEYVEDIDAWDRAQAEMEKARVEGNEDRYFEIIDTVGKLRQRTNIRKPIFITDIFSVAKTYADPSRVHTDYQNSIEKVVKVEVSDGKSATIVATGHRFRFIPVDMVRAGFTRAGINPEELDLVIRKLNFAIGTEKGIKTDDIAAIGDWFGFDYIDVKGVLDSYHGGTTKSTVRMVFDPSHLKIVK